MTMTPEAKKALSTTIRGLREHLVGLPGAPDAGALHAATESAYRLSVRAQDAGLPEAARIQRDRLEAWMAEQVRADAKDKGGKGRGRDAFRRQAEKQAAYTLLNRLVVLRLIEANPRGDRAERPPAVLTGGWESPAYRQFRELAPALVKDDPTEGYATLLQLVFEDLALELPGIFGPAGVADLVPIPPATLRHLVDALGDPALATCWADDMTLGWVYQYWNDPEREAIDDKLNAGGKVEPHEIASKTQMFTERYMVDWLLQNSLGPMWLAMCAKHGWTAEVVADGTLDRLEARRVDWRGKRERGEVSLTALMPLETAAERRWAYYVPQPLPDDAKDHAPASVRDLRLLDPAVGSGHFLVVAMDLLFALYREEARHRGESAEPRWRDTAIVERILGHNLNGIDLDPRAVQIAAATLWLKARQLAPEARPTRLNLVAANLRLASLPDDDPALAELRREVERDTGIPGELTDTIVHALRGADHLGSLLKVDEVVEAALSEQEQRLGRVEPQQVPMFGAAPAQQVRMPIAKEDARATVLDRLEGFLARHTGADDLGLRLRGEQLAAGVRFVRMVREGTYDLVVGNPPYQGTAKMADWKYLNDGYPAGKSDLYGAFMERGVALCRRGGTSAFVTMRSWMFIGAFRTLRDRILDTLNILIADLSYGAFSSMKDNPIVLVRFGRCAKVGDGRFVAPVDAERVRDLAQMQRITSGLMCQAKSYETSPHLFRLIESSPLTYWWTRTEFLEYAELPKIGEKFAVRFGMITSGNTRFIRNGWEIPSSAASSIPPSAPIGEAGSRSWARYLMGTDGRCWVDPVDRICRWRWRAAEVRVAVEHRYGSISRKMNEATFFTPGVAFSMMGSSFSARVHRWRCVMDNRGSSVLTDALAPVVCSMNASRSRRMLESLNPTIAFQVGDVNRLPLFPISEADRIFTAIERAFTLHESHREPSVEYRSPGPTPWRHAQEWAQLAVDRPEGAPLPDYVEELDPEPATDHLSYALGVALGRFGPAGEGILDPATADLFHALPHGVLLLDGTLDSPEAGDDLGHAAAAPLHAAWTAHRPDTKRDTLREWLRLDFFGDVHRTMYENRPIHWPLSSSGRTFVAWVTIHRWTPNTLTEVLAKLADVTKRLDGEVTDLRVVRDGKDKAAARAAEKRLEKVQKWRKELAEFVDVIERCADKGPPPTDPNPTKCPPRASDAKYAPDLDDGVMVNSAALWPLLEPQWKDPKKWWTELATSKGRKDHDWSHLAMRYWPARVDAKCQADPSLGVAHGCFWRYHSARAWAWELRLQDEIGPDFRIEEAPYAHPDGTRSPDHVALRAAWLRDHAVEALAAIEKEALRRGGRGKAWRPVPEMSILEAGLWSTFPERCWKTEISVSELQGVEFFLRAPDETAARAAFEIQHPDAVADRRAPMAKLKPPVGLFGADDESDENGEGAAEEDEG